MNRRERILLIGVGVLLACIAVGFAFSRVTDSLAYRRRQIGELQKQRGDRQHRLRSAARAKQRLEVYREMSLPSDHDLAANLYESWLLAEVNRVGMSNVRLTPSSSNVRSQAYHQHTVTLTCKGNLEQMAELLCAFYSADYLHRLKQLKAQPIVGSKDLNLLLVAEALSLPKAKHEDQLNPEPSNRLTLGDKDDYVRAIVERNLFSPANHAPKFASLSSQRGSPNRPLTFTVKADDPDPLDKVTFSLASETTLPGAKLDPKTGEFRWVPTEKGEFEVAIVATDNGLPARSAEQIVKINVTDPPPEPPKTKPTLAFDNAKHTFLTAIVNDGGKLQIWLTVRTTGDVLKLYKGDLVSVGSIEDAEVSDITATTASFDMEGKRRTINLGQHLLEGMERPVESAVETTSEDDSTASTSVSNRS